MEQHPNAKLTPKGRETLVLRVESDLSRVRPRRAATRRVQGHLCDVRWLRPRFFEGMGVRVERVVTDNGPSCCGGEFNALLEAEGVRHVYTRPFSPWQNGKVERMNHTLVQK